MKSKTYFIVILLFCAAGFPAGAQESGNIAPPSWIKGTWTYIEKFFGQEEAGTEAALHFAADDIFFDGDEHSLSGLIAQGEVAAFAQKVGEASYEIYITYPDGFWYREIFHKPSAAGADTMKSVYENSEDDSSGFVYTRGQP